MRTHNSDHIIDAQIIAPAPSHRRQTLASRALPFLPALLLAFAVLSFGATTEWAQFGLQLGAAALLLLWTALKLNDPALNLPRNPLLFPILIVPATALVQLGCRTTAYTYATKCELMMYLAYAAIFLVACDFWKDETDRNAVLIFLSVFGFGLALFAILQGLISNGKIFWLVTPQLGGALYGPYVNRNHYAGIMELLVPVPFALATVRNKSFAYRVLLIFMGTVMAISIFTSQSRAGMMAFVVEMLILCLLVLRMRRSIRTGASIAFAALIFVAFFVLLGGGALLDRFGTIADQVRPAVIKDSLRMIAQRPMLGWGFGTFPTVYPHFRSFYTDLFVNQAHNDVIQFVVEAGTVGLLSALWFVVVLYRRALPSLQHWTTHSPSVLAGMVGCTGLLFHSFFDFNLHIPANALAFFLFCVLATSRHSPDHSRLIS